MTWVKSQSAVEDRIADVLADNDYRMRSHGHTANGVNERWTDNGDPLYESPGQWGRRLFDVLDNEDAYFRGWENGMTHAELNYCEPCAVAWSPKAKGIGLYCWSCGQPAKPRPNSNWASRSWKRARANVLREFEEQCEYGARVCADLDWDAVF